MRTWLWLLVLFPLGCHSLYDEPTFPEGLSADEIELPPSASPSPSTAPYADDVPPPAPRLRRTKTLGFSESADGVAARGRPADGATALGTTVIINTTVTQVAPSVTYWGPGLSGSTVHGRGVNGAGAAAPAQDGRSRGGTGVAPSPSPPVGGDWPRVPSYGPR